MYICIKGERYQFRRSDSGYFRKLGDYYNTNQSTNNNTYLSGLSVSGPRTRYSQTPQLI